MLVLNFNKFIMIHNPTITRYIDAAIAMLKEQDMNVAAYNGIVSLLTEAKQLDKQKQEPEIYTCKNCGCFVFTPEGECVMCGHQ